MRTHRLLIIETLAIVALGVAVAPAVVNAESDGQPAALILSGKVSELTTTGEATKHEIFTVLGNAKNIEDGGEVEGKKEPSAKVTLKGCKELEGKPLDTSECEGLTELRGVHITGTTTLCRSETLAGVKDGLGVVLVKGLLHAAAEKSTSGVLEPLGIAKVLSVDGTSPLEVACGVVKVRVSGRIGCLGLPGLMEAEKGEVVCNTTSTPGDQETGTCEVPASACKELKEDPFVGGFTETEKTDSALLVRVVGTSNKPVFGDD